MIRLAPRSIARRVRVGLDLRLPDKRVRRAVRGVEMAMPRRHIVWYLTSDDSPYGRNIIELARLLHAAEGDLEMLDVGANIGDTTLTVLAEAPGHVVCVEPDPQWLSYLEENVGGRPDVSIEPTAVLPGDEGVSYRIVHEDAGSSRLEPVATSSDEAADVISTAELRARHPDLDKVRLIKTDTDGYDVQLAPALARTFAGSTPVIFLEFDPVATKVATPDLNPSDMWRELLDLGYEHAVVWNNGGRLVGPATVESLQARTDALAQRTRGHHVFWDVAVAHRDDRVGRDVLARLCWDDAAAGVRAIEPEPVQP